MQKSDFPKGKLLFKALIQSWVFEQGVGQDDLWMKMILR